MTFIDATRAAWNCAIERARSSSLRCSSICRASAPPITLSRSCSAAKRAFCSAARSRAWATSLPLASCFSPSVANIVACRRASLAAACAVATAACCWSRWVFTFVCRFTSAASAAVTCRPASSASSCTSGLESSSSSEPEGTVAPGRTGSFSTRPAVRAETSRTCSGTRVPGARTARSIVPRCTESIQSVERSTVGAALGSRPSATVASTSTAIPPPASAYLPRFFLGSRAMSIDVLGG